MTLKPPSTERTPTVGHISRAAQVRVDERLREIRAHRVALDRARPAAEDVNRAQEQDRCRP
jgi:hypothetical protein